MNCNDEDNINNMNDVNDMNNNEINGGDNPNNIINVEEGNENEDVNDDVNEDTDNVINDLDDGNMHNFTKFKNIVERKGGQLLSDYSLYINARSELTVQCQDNHIFMTDGTRLNRNIWCSKCNMNQCEQLSIRIIEFLTGEEFNKIRPEFLRYHNGWKLELDGFNEKLMLAVEVQGRQHYEF